MGTGDTVECQFIQKTWQRKEVFCYTQWQHILRNFDPVGEFNIYLNSGNQAGLNNTRKFNRIYKWNHVALVKHSNVVKVYVNGLAIGSYSHSGQEVIMHPYNFMSNRWWWKWCVKLYMQDMRIYKGVAKYTDTFTCAD